MFSLVFLYLTRGDLCHSLHYWLCCVVSTQPLPHLHHLATFLPLLSCNSCLPSLPSLLEATATLSPPCCLFLLLFLLCPPPVLPLVSSSLAAISGMSCTINPRHCAACSLPQVYYTTPRHHDPRPAPRMCLAVTSILVSFCFLLRHKSSCPPPFPLPLPSFLPLSLTCLLSLVFFSSFLFFNFSYIVCCYRRCSAPP